jgi:hypothetical protein
MRTSKPLIIATFVLLLAVSIAGIAQQQKSTAQTPQRGGSMQMGDMMTACREHCQSTSNSIDQLSRTIDEAKKSNDPAKMRAALESVQKPLADMKNHMSMCMSMMDMMKNMHGGTGEPTNKAPEKK